jgi:hypothetical protein
MKLLFLLLLFCYGMFGPRAYAQENLQDGYIVSVRGDTVRGKIAYRDWVATPGRIDFQDGKTGVQHSYGLADLLGFGVHQEVFRRYTVHIAPYSQEPAVVTASSWHGDPYDTTVFLRLVTSGKLNLYYYRDELDVTYFFFQRQGNAPEQLLIRNRVIRAPAKTDVITDKLYQYQLADLVASCSLVAERPVKIAYEENALRKLIETYNHCGKEEGGKKRGFVRLGFIPMVGYLHSGVKPGGNTDVAHAGFPAYNGPTGGVGVLIQPARGRKRLALLVDGLYDHFSVSSGKFQKDYYESYSGKMDYDEVKIDLQVRYLYPLGGDYRPFVGFGFSNSLIINNNSTQSLFDANNAQTIRQPLFGSTEAVRTYRPGGFVTLGVSRRRWSIEGRFERTAGLTNLPGVTTPVTNFFVLVGFRL